MQIKVKDSKFLKKYYRKVVTALKKDYNDEIKISNTATQHLFVGNGGMLCQRTRQQLLTLFSTEGRVTNLVMIPNKSYSFLSYATLSCAQQAVQVLNAYVFKEDECGSQPIAPLYLFYLQNSIPSHMVSPGEAYPTRDKFPYVDGLHLSSEILDEQYETELFQFFMHTSAASCDDGNMEASLKNRSVKHFGYEFLYGTNNIDRSKPLEAKIPSICTPLLEKMLNLGLMKCMPDQLTVNEYAAGQGIPSHIDTHSAFTDTIVSVTLGHEVVMDFTSPITLQKVPAILPRRSALVMSGESRYLWSHGIVPRSHDVYYTLDEDIEEGGKYHLTSEPRGVRISLTFRKILNEPCTCAWIEQCDSQNNQNSLFVPDTNNEAADLEAQQVHSVYEEIAPHFSDTRHTAWPRVKDFVCSLPRGSLLADVGCGNGKYLGCNEHVVSMGCDRSSNLLSICAERGFEVLIADCLQLPYRSNSFDATICIAVVHHLSTDDRRLDAIRELVRVTCVGGRVLVTVWAMEQDPEEEVSLRKTSLNDEEIPSLNSMTLKDASEPSIPRARIEVSEGRYKFQQQDLLVPWHLKGNENNNVKGEEGNKEKVFHRFYHVFKRGELERLCELLGNVSVEEVYFDKGNWCVILKKLTSYMKLL